MSQGLHSGMAVQRRPSKPHREGCAGSRFRQRHHSVLREQACVGAFLGGDSFKEPRSPADAATASGMPESWCYPRSSRVRRLRWRSGLGHGRLHRGDMHRRCRVGQCPKYLRCVRLYVRSGRTVRFADKLVHRGKRAYFRYDVPTRISSAAVRQSLCHP